MTKSAGLPIVLISILFLADLEAVTVVINQQPDEYLLEHQVPYEDAIAEARKLDVFPGPIPGCKPCTNSEMTYCKNNDVINDHCCCDGSYNKVFPFIEHTCRVGPKECKVQAGDCAEYTRLRECCCYSYLASVWKNLATSRGSRPDADLIKLLTTLAALRLLLPTIT